GRMCTLIMRSGAKRRKMVLHLSTDMMGPSKNKNFTLNCLLFTLKRHQQTSATGKQLTV
ncbi:CCR4-NOT transcription complex subunit 3-like protein, partial [Elysia marginata]